MFIKEIVAEGKYLVTVPERKPDGSLSMNRKWVNIDEAYLAEVSKNTNALINTGHKIPMPLYDHSLKAMPTPAQAANDPALGFRNGGWFTNFQVSTNKAGKKALYGIVEAANDETAKLIGT